MARAVLFAVLLASSLARADEAVVATLPPSPASAAILPWILPHDGLRIDATAEIEASAAKVAKPLAIAPDAWFGATDDLTLGIVESKYAMTGFRGSAGAGFCVTGSTEGCPHLYNNVGGEGWGALARGRLSLVGGGGVYATDITKHFYAVKLGFKVRATAGRVSLSVMPSIFIAADHRDDMTPNTDALYVPVAFTIKPNANLAFGLGSGIKGPVEGFASKWAVPIGFNAAVTLGPVQIGGALTWGALFGGATNPPPPMPQVVGSDVRVVQAWLSYAWSPAQSHPKAEIVARGPAPPPSPATPKPVPVTAPEPVAAVIESATAQLAGAASEQIVGDAIAQVARDHTSEIHACSNARGIAGQIAIAFEIDHGGNVTRTALASTVGDVGVGDCLLRTLRAWRFPEPASSAASGVYTISFE
jgi:hypothetical protein